MRAAVAPWVDGHSLAHVAFGGGVEGGQLHCAGILWSHLKQHFLEGVKLIVFVHIILVDLRTNSHDRRKPPTLNRISPLVDSG